MVSFLKSDIVLQQVNKATSCSLDPSESNRLAAMRIVNLILFSILALLWLINLSVMVLKKRIHNILITGLLYGIIAIIIICRLIEVSEARVFETLKIVVVTGIIATYGKICLGCCQLSAMFEIKT